MVVAVMAGGCSAKIVPTDQAAVLPHKRIHDIRATTQKDDAGIVIVKRDSGYVGSAVNASIFLNGELAAELATSEKVTFYLPEGRYLISAMLNGPAGELKEIETMVTKNRTDVFRVGFFYGNFSITRTNF